MEGGRTRTCEVCVRNRKRKDGRKRRKRCAEYIWTRSEVKQFFEKLKIIRSRAEKEKEKKERGVNRGRHIRGLEGMRAPYEEVTSGPRFKWAALGGIGLKWPRDSLLSLYLTLHVHNQQTPARCPSVYERRVRARSALNDGQRRKRRGTSEREGDCQLRHHAEGSGQTFVITRSFNMSGISVRPFNAWPASKKLEYTEYG